eukprot:COSAG06_NODE_2492_length_6769_cov_2.361619_1_plen_127_part_00
MIISVSKVDRKHNYVIIIIIVIYIMMMIFRAPSSSSAELSGRVSSAAAVSAAADGGGSSGKLSSAPGVLPIQCLNSRGTKRGQIFLSQHSFVFPAAVWSCSWQINHTIIYISLLSTNEIYHYIFIY